MIVFGAAVNAVYLAMYSGYALIVPNQAFFISLLIIFEVTLVRARLIDDQSPVLERRRALSAAGVECWFEW